MIFLSVVLDSLKKKNKGGTCLNALKSLILGSGKVPKVPTATISSLVRLTEWLLQPPSSNEALAGIQACIAPHST